METHRTHDFDGLQFGPRPTVDELIGLLERLDDDFERQRLRLLEVFEWFELAVTEQVAVERHRDQLAHRIGELEAELAAVRRELEALRSTRLFRAAAPARRLYARIRRRG